jgi:hypothetical protein
LQPSRACVVNHDLDYMYSYCSDSYFDLKIGVSNEHKEGHLLAREDDHVCNPRHCNFGLYSVVLVTYWMDVFGHRYYRSKYSSTMTFRSD